MTPEEFEDWNSLYYRMEEEGMEYCFKHYSSFKEIKDEKFHELRLKLIALMWEMEQYVETTLNSYIDEDDKLYDEN